MTLLKNQRLTTQLKNYLILALVILGAAVLISPKSNPAYTNLYRFKRIREKISLAFQLTPKSKARYYRYQLDLRLTELNQLLNQKDYDMIRYSSLRYSTTARDLTERITRHNLADEIAPTVKLLKQHLAIFEDLLSRYPPNFDNELEPLRDAYYCLHIYLNQLSHDNVT